MATRPIRKQESPGPVNAGVNFRQAAAGPDIGGEWGRLKRFFEVKIGEAARMTNDK
jgi:hypothetical protein